MVGVVIVMRMVVNVGFWCPMFPSTVRLTLWCVVTLAAGLGFGITFHPPVRHPLIFVKTPSVTVSA